MPEAQGPVDAAPVPEGAGSDDAASGRLVREPRTGLMLDERMAERYGVRPANPWAVGAIGVLVVAFVAGVLGLGYKLATPSTLPKLLTFSVQSPTAVDVTFEVRRDGRVETWCVLRARAVDHTDVGYATVRITPGADYVQRTYTIATYAEATTAEVLGCEAGGPPAVDAPAFRPGTTNPEQVEVLDGT